MNYDILDVMKLLPHRYPFLLVDKIVSMSEDTVVGIKNVTINEPFFQGHFPGAPVMPGVLIVESMAQAGGFLLLHSIEHPEKKLAYFGKIDEVRFRKPVKPGDVLRHEVKKIKMSKKYCVMEVKTYVEDTLVAEGKLTAFIVDR